MFELLKRLVPSRFVYVIALAISVAGCGGTGPTPETVAFEPVESRPPARSPNGMVVSVERRASQVGRAVLEGEERFPDMSEPYDLALRDLMRDVALEHEIALQEGVYAGVLGPNYETPAEIRMLARLGADAVGMSTVPEVIAAKARGMRVLGISTITNVAAGLSTKRLTHDEVLAAGERMSERLKTLVRGVVKNL